MPGWSLARREVAGLSAMVGRIGAERAAERLGVTRRTVRDWVKRGVPQRRAGDVQGAADRSARSAHAGKMRSAYRRLGWTKFGNMTEVDLFIGADPGHTAERFKHRREWWEEHRPEDHLPKRASIVRTADGQLLYINGDQVVWRGYMVDARLFWTQATYLEGYDTAAQMADVYESLVGHSLVIHFG